MMMHAHSELQTIPGVGPSLAQDLSDLGYQQLSELRNANPERMYDELCALRDQYIDRCVLYVFRCAVYYASHAEHQPELLQWWNWKDCQGMINCHCGDDDMDVVG